jgi:L-arabinose isomerase
MQKKVLRREFLQLTLTGSALCLCGLGGLAFRSVPNGSRLISPGCRRTKVKVARIYMGTPSGLWPKPNMDFQKEIQTYESEFNKLKEELYDVEFVINELVTTPEKASNIKNRLKDVDGILVIHLSLGISQILNEIISTGLPTIVFAVPYSGHEWANFSSLLNQPLGSRMDCILTSDYQQLATAIRPFRAIHHLREAKILNLTTGSFVEYADNIKNKFGTEIKQIELKRMIDVYNSIDDTKAKTETNQWIKEAVQIIEPSNEDIFKSCKLALAFEKLMDEEDATVMTADCYGTMYSPLCQSYAFPCLGFTRLNNMGLGGICESDLPSAITHVLFQGLVGRPGFISDPTVDESINSIILAHCLGTTKMDGPDKPAASYKLRSIMERQEGVVPQVEMRIGQKVTQAILKGTDFLPYFTGEIIATPVALKDDRGCRTKITVKVDGDVTKLWKNWTSGLHRQTCYGDITKELAFFCRFKDIKMVNEAI